MASLVHLTRTVFGPLLRIAGSAKRTAPHLRLRRPGRLHGPHRAARRRGGRDGGGGRRDERCGARVPRAPVVQERVGADLGVLGPPPAAARGGARPGCSARAQPGVTTFEVPITSPFLSRAWT